MEKKMKAEAKRQRRSERKQLEQADPIEAKDEPASPFEGSSEDDA